MKNIPNHIAIIPDGNRRWAKKRNMKPWEGHTAGAEIFGKLSEKALELGIKHLTFWGSSKDNLIKRPILEKKALLNIFETYFQKLFSAKKICDKKIRVNVLGDWKKQFPNKLINILEDGIQKTQNHNQYFLNFLLAYDGMSDVISSIQSIANKLKDNPNKDIKITDKLVWDNLITNELPEVDLIIRTGVENDPHNSVGFLMWQSRNSQYYFSDKMFPDFNAKEFEKAIIDFQKRERRFGK